MPNIRDFEKLNGTQKRVYRAIHDLYIEHKASPSLPEISAKSGINVPNVHPITNWLALKGWVSKVPHQHRSIKPLVNLKRRTAKKTA